MLHASDNKRSNTVWLGEQVLARLPDAFETKTISLQNGSIHDCRGCSYEACLHFAAQSRCFYGGSISDEVLPAISACDAMLFLCPNYNDAVSANIMALFNRLTNLLVKQDLYQKYLYGIVVSGYSGSDIVARQLLGCNVPESRRPSCRRTSASCRRRTTPAPSGLRTGSTHGSRNLPHVLRKFKLYKNENPAGI